MKLFVQFILFTAAFSILLFSCRTSKKAEKPRAVKKAEKRDTAVAPEKKETVKIIYEPKKATYKVGMLLPFHLDSLHTASPGEEHTGAPVSEAAALALEFYEGALMAIDSFKKSGINIDFFIYDCPDDTNQLKKMLREHAALDSVQMLVGISNNNGLRLLAEYAKQRKTYLLSPFSPSASITESNPYFIMTNPTLKTHCEAIFSFINDNSSNRKIFMFHQNEESENNIASLFNNLSKKDTPVTNITEIIFDITRKLDSTLFSIAERNVVIIPSFDEVFINHIIGQLKNLSSSYNIVVFGMPAWDEMESLRTEYLQKLNVHISSSFWANHSDTSVIDFEKNYFEKYKTVPGRNAFLGYDMMFYLKNLFTGSEKEFAYRVQTTPTLYLLSTWLKIKPSFSRHKAENVLTGFDYYENKYIHILKFEDYSLKKVN